MISLHVLSKTIYLSGCLQWPKSQKSVSPYIIPGFTQVGGHFPPTADDKVLAVHPQSLELQKETR